MSKNKKKDVKMMEIEYYMSPNGTLKPNIQILTFFDEDLTEEEKEKIFDKIDDLTYELYHCIETIEGRIKEDE